MSHRPLDRKASMPDHAASEQVALDDLLSRRFNAPEEQLAPSSGFVLAVMDEVHQSVSVPSPLAFPWSRVVPGLIAVLSSFIAFFLYAWNKHDAHRPFDPHLAVALPVFSPAGLVLCWSACALCLSIAIAAAAFRFTNHDSW